MTHTEPAARAALRRVLTDRIGQELFHADVLDGRTERSATWEGATDSDREHYRAQARAMLRRNEPIVLDVAGHKARQAALASLPPSCRMFLTDEARKDFDIAIDAAIAAREAHLLYGNPQQDQRLFEQVHSIPPARDFTVVDGGRA